MTGSKEIGKHLSHCLKAVLLPLGCYTDHHEEPHSQGTELMNDRGYSHVTFVAGRW